MHRKMLLLLLLLSLPSLATAEPWTTDAAVGPNEVAVTLDITCPAISFVCSVVDGYSDMQTSTLTGSGTYQFDEVLETIQFDSDSSQDLGGGPQPAYLTMSGSDLTFANVPFAGIPEIVNLLVFALTNPAISLPGVDLLTPGDYPFSTTLDYASTSEVTGDLEFLLPDFVIGPNAVGVTGTFRVLGDVDLDGFIEIEIRDVSATLLLQSNGFIGGEPVTFDVTSVLTANLSTEIEGPPVEVPTLGLGSLFVLCGLIIVVAIGTQRRFA